MKKKPWLLMLASLLLVAGCSWAPRSDTALVPRDCDTADGTRTCRIAITPSASGAYSCAIGRFNIDPDFVRLVGRRPVTLQWNLPAPYAFCEGDRPFLKNPSVADAEEVWESFAVDNAEGFRKGGERAGQCRSSWSWTWNNRERDREYTYGVTFRDQNSGRTCTIDPWVKNGR